MFTQDDLGYFYEKHFERIYRFFYYKSLDKSLAEDLTSEVFLNFAQALQNEKSIKEPDKYLMGVAKITFCKHLEKKYQLQQTSLESLEIENQISSTESEYREYNTVEDLLVSVLDLIPTKQKQVLDLRFLQKMSVSDTAVHLGRDENYVRTTQKRGLQSLRAIIATKGLDIKTTDLVVQDDAE